MIKFVGQYGADAHQLLADAGMAPQLLYSGLLDGADDIRNAGSRGLGSTVDGMYIGLVRMVIAEHLEGDTMDKASPAAWPKDALEQIEKAIKKLHDAGLVFGDLRGPNVLLSEGRISSISTGLGREVRPGAPCVCRAE